MVLALDGTSEICAHEDYGLKKDNYRQACRSPEIWRKKKKILLPVFPSFYPFSTKQIGSDRQGKIRIQIRPSRKVRIRVCSPACYPISFKLLVGMPRKLRGGGDEERLNNSAPKISLILLELLISSCGSPCENQKKGFQNFFR